MRVLLTGVPGWLGSRFLEILNEGSDDTAVPEELRKYFTGAEVSCLVLPNQDISFLERLERKSIHIYRGDLREGKSLFDFLKEAEGSVLVHLAGIIHPRAHIRELFELNVRGSETLIQSALRRNIKKIIVISSNSPVGCNPDRTHLFTEESAYHPYMAYGRSKMELENMVRQYTSRYDADITILRPCWFYGPNQPDRQTRYFTMVREGKAPLVGDGGNRRSMSYVDNTCQAILRAIVNPASRGQTYWVADERPYPMIEIIDTIRIVLHEDFDIPVKNSYLRLPSFTSDCACLVDGLIQKFGLYNQKIHVLSEMNKNIACSIDKAVRELGYHPTVSLREGMSRSVSWCLAQGRTI